MTQVSVRCSTARAGCLMDVWLTSKIYLMHAITRRVLHDHSLPSPTHATGATVAP